MEWSYYILLLEHGGKSYDDYIEGVGADEGGFWIGSDFSVAKPFESTDDLHLWAKQHGLSDAKYAVHGFLNV